MLPEEALLITIWDCWLSHLLPRCNSRVICTTIVYTAQLMDSYESTFPFNYCNLVALHSHYTVNCLAGVSDNVQAHWKWREDLTTQIKVRLEASCWVLLAGLQIVRSRDVYSMHTAKYGLEQKPLPLFYLVVSMYQGELISLSCAAMLAGAQPLWRGKRIGRHVCRGRLICSWICSCK